MEDSGHPFNLNVRPLADSNIEEGGNLAEKMRCIERENMNIMKSLAELFDKYEAMHHQLIDLMRLRAKPESAFEKVEEADDDEPELIGKKRKASDLRFDGGDDATSAQLHSCISDQVCCRRAAFINHKPKTSAAYVRIDQSDTSLIVKDGYQWRKYGQKTTRDNPSPRAYYKCSFAPLCAVKKKVQRSVEDASVVVVTYEGEHNHKKPPSGATLSASSADLIMEPEDVAEGCLLQQPGLVEQMASTLTKDASFTSALASAICSKVLNHKY